MSTAARITRRCSCCGECGRDHVADPRRWRRKTSVVCGDCYAELALGKITDSVRQSVEFFGGVAGVKEDGPSPWQENAIGDMES